MPDPTPNDATYAIDMLSRLATDGMTFETATVTVNGDPLTTYRVTDADPATGEPRTRNLTVDELAGWAPFLRAIEASGPDITSNQD